MLRSLVVLSCVSSLLSSLASGQSTTWTGAVNSTWQVAGNWTAGIPNSATDAVVPPAANPPSLFTGNAACRDLHVQAGGALLLSAGRELIVADDLDLDGQLTQATGSLLRVAGDWVNDGTFTHGGADVLFVGSGPIGGSSTTTFHDVTVSGARTSMSAWVVDGDVTVNAGATLALGAFTHIVVGGFTAAEGAAVTGIGTLQFTGTGTLTTGTGGVPHVLVSRGVRSAASATITGTLTMTGGQLQILDNATLAVLDDATLSGGTLGWTSTAAGNETLDVEGDLVLGGAAGSTSPTAFVRCAGILTASASFFPAQGVVVLDGAGASTIEGSPDLAELRVASGTRTAAVPLKVDVLVVEGGATLVTNAPLDAIHVTLSAPTATWSAGSSTHTIAGNLLSSGADVDGTGPIVFDGPGALAGLAGPVSVPPVRVDAGVRLVFDVTVAGNLELTAGELHVVDDALVTVQGDLVLDTGVLAFLDTTGGFETLHVDGNVSIDAAAGATSVSTLLECEGDWTSGPAFLPASGTIAFVGPAARTVAGSRFPNLRLEGGSTTITEPADVPGTLTILAGALLITDAPLDVDGSVDIDGSWALGGQAHTVAGDWLGLGAVASGPGVLVFDGTGLLLTNGGSVPDVVVAAGTRTIQTGLLGSLSMTGGTILIGDDQLVAVQGDLSATSGTLSWPATADGAPDQLSVLGSATVTAAAGTTSADARLAVVGDWSSSAAFAPAAGIVVLDGGAATIGGPSPTFSTLRVTGTGKTLVASATVGNDLVLSSGGALAVAAPLLVVDALDIGGNALVTTTATIDVNGDVLLPSAGVVLDLGADLLLGGDWTSLGASVTASTGTAAVRCDATGTMDTGGGSIPRLVVAAGARQVTLADVTGDLLLQGGALRILDDATVTVGGDALLTGGVLEWTPVAANGEDVLDIAGSLAMTASTGSSSAMSRLRVAGEWTSGAGFAPAAGRTELTGSATTSIAGTAAFADLAILGGTRAVVGDVSIGGALDVATGATLVLMTGVEVVDAVALAAGSAGAMLVVEAPLSVGASLVLGDGAGATTSAPLSIGDDLVLGSGVLLDTGAPVDVGRDALLADASSSWLLGGLTHTVAGDWTSTGGTASGGVLAFTDDGTVGAGGGPLPDVLVTGGTRTLAGAVALDSLDVQDGTLLLADDALVTVAGAFTLAPPASLAMQAGLPGEELLDVEGPVAMLGSAGTTSAQSTVRCASSWTSGEAFAPAAGRVVLDAAGVQTIAAASPGERPTFATLELLAPTTSPAADLDLVAQTVTVAPGAELLVGDLALGLLTDVLDVQGALTVGAGGELGLGPTTAATCALASTLTLAGALGDPALVTGRDGNGYALVVEGTLVAQHFVFERMGPAGVVVTADAVLGVPPQDLRAGTFDRGAAALGSVLLDIERPAPTDLRYLVLADSDGTLPSNVRVDGGQPISFTNATGALAGELFEDDPFGLVSWVSEMTVLASLEATPALLSATLEWTTSLEIDVEAFVLERGPAPSGPFAAIGELPATGAGPYTFPDTVAEGGTYRWRLIERLTHGATNLLGEVDATIWGPGLPPNVLEVGPGAPFADVGTAIAASSGIVSPIVLVRPGSYPAFTITTGSIGTLRVIGDGTGAVVIASAAQPVEIHDLLVTDSVELADLQLGDGTGLAEALVVRDCAGLVVLDEVTVVGGAQAGVRVDASTRVAIQRCDVSGAPGLRLESGSLAIAGRGSLDDTEVAGGSSLRVAQLSPATTIEPGSLFESFPGVHADVDGPTLIGLGEPFTLTLSGAPLGQWSLILAASYGWIDLPGQKWEMVGIASLAPFGVLLSGGFGGGGVLPLPIAMPPDADLLGIPILLQTIVLDPGTNRLRWSNVATLVGMPQTP